VLLYSKQTSLLTMAAEALLALIFPFRWEHVYIPVLPLQLLEFVNAPTPFIMGVNTHSLRNRSPPRPSAARWLSPALLTPPSPPAQLPPSPRGRLISERAAAACPGVTRSSPRRAPRTCSW
jgi:hypothetical protein